MTKIIKHNEFLLVEVPEDLPNGISFEYENHNALRYHPKDYKNIHDTRRIELPSGNNYSIIGMVKDLLGDDTFCKDFADSPMNVLSLLKSHSLNENNCLVLKTLKLNIRQITASKTKANELVVKFGAKPGISGFDVIEGRRLASMCVEEIIDNHSHRKGHTIEEFNFWNDVLAHIKKIR